MKKILCIILLMVSAILPFQASALGQQHRVMGNKMQERVLWGASISPYVRTVLVTLNEKKVPFTHKKVLPSKVLQATGRQVDLHFEAISPFGKIPAYEEISKIDSFSIAESAVIIDYLNDTIANVPLRPKCPKANARVSFFVAYGGNTLAPATHAILFENIVKPLELKEKTDIAKVEKIINEELPPILDFLEKTLSDGRTWIADTKNFSLGDIVMGSHLVTLSTANITLEDIIGKDRPYLLGYIQKIMDRESFKKALAIETTPQYLYKVLSVEDWKASQKLQSVKLSTEDKEFIHLATKEQLDKIIEKYWKDKDFIVLKIETTLLPGKLLLEANPGGTHKYYHLYGSQLPLNSVVEL